MAGHKCAKLQRTASTYECCVHVCAHQGSRTGKQPARKEDKPHTLSCNCTVGHMTRPIDTHGVL